ncbi:hypothetical protein SAMN05216338_105438 [Bradyrhizobium sp. Rc2d]|nr:hypothetical protein SAMN05216338_105438 [Bradyrhizobium sp. Rc2d]
MRRADALFHGPCDGLRPAGISLLAKIAGWWLRSKAAVCLYGSSYCAGRIAIETELSLAPLTWSTKGCADS